MIKNRNMVRAGVVDHPDQCHHCGYKESQNLRRKNILIDYEIFGCLFGFSSFDKFQSALFENKSQRLEIKSDIERIIKDSIQYAF